MSVRKWDTAVDFVIGGSGIGGATAAIKADEEDMGVLVLEKSSKVGGVSAVSGGLLWVGNNHLQGEPGVEDSAETVEEYLRYGATGPIDDELLDAFVRRAPEALEFLDEVADVPWNLVADSPDYLHPKTPSARPEGRKLEVAPIRRSEVGDLADDLRLSPHFPVGVTLSELKSWGGLGSYEDWDRELLDGRIEEGFLTFGPGVMGHLLAEVDRRNIEVKTETPIEGLVTEDNRVVGVEARTDEGTMTVRARGGVLLAIGGYDWSQEKVERYEFVPEMESAAPPIVHGDHLDLTEGLSADVAIRTEEGRLPVTPAGVHVPGEEMEGVPLYRILAATRGVPGSIVVNGTGERFHNEAYWPDFIANIGRIDVFEGDHRNWPCFFILDQDHRDAYPVAGIEPGQDLSEHLGEKGETLEELAEKLGVDSDGLLETVETFNENAREGVDPEFHRGETTIETKFWGDPNHEPSANLAPISTPPFYGFELDIVGTGVPSAGLRIDGSARVLDEEGRAIPGLYAAGNTAAYTDTGGSYDSGIAMARGMTYGFVSASHASRS